MKNNFSLSAMIFAFSLMACDASASTVIGAGSCEQWLDAQNKPSERAIYTIWLNGYLSGANVMYGEMLDRDFIKNSDKISIVDWTDAYCQKYPKSKLDDSAKALVNVLKRDLPF